MKTELWKAVPGYDGLYEVSSLGRVRALFFANNNQHKPGRILKPDAHRNHYLFVGLYRPGEGRVAKSIHSLVLEAFSGPRPVGKVSRHLDGVRTHNTPENLSWGTISENCDDAKKHGTFVLGEKNGYSKLTEQEVRNMRNLRDAGATYVSLGKRFNTHWSNAWMICNGKTWNHVSQSVC